MILILLAFLICFFMPQSAQATVLGDAAAALSPGQWVKLNSIQMPNINITAQPPAWDDAGTIGPGFDGAQPGWNSHTRQLYLESSEHNRDTGVNWCPDSFPNYPNSCWRRITVYNADTNLWDVTTYPYPHDAGNNPVIGIHVWGGIAYDDDNQVMYVRKHADNSGGHIFRYCAPTSVASFCASQLGDWVEIPFYSHPANNFQGAALGWHKAMGRLLYWENVGAGTGCGALAAYNPVTNTWATVGNQYPLCTYPSDGDYSMAGMYSTVKQVMVFITGNKNTYKVSSAGVITRLTDAPCGFGTTTTVFGTGAEDPNTGDIYYIGCGAPGQMWKLDPNGSGTWTVIDSNLGTTGKICETRGGGGTCSEDFYATPISTYGVIGFWKFIRTFPATAEYWIYKPSTSTDVVAPTVSITAPTAGATVSGTLVSITATASDNVGVVGVQFKVDGVNLGIEDTNAAYAIIWDSTGVANGTHSISATARDAAGNIANASGVNVTVSNVAGGSDFDTRCKAAGVVLCVPFDSATEIACQSPTVPGALTGFQYCNHGIDQQYVLNGTPPPTIDTNVKASGNGSLKMTIPSLSGAAGSGSYFTNFDQTNALTKRYGAGQTFYIQWRQRFSPEFLNTIYFKNGGGNAGGWKTTIITTGDVPGTCPVGTEGDHCTSYTVSGVPIAGFSSCTPIDIPTQNTEQRGLIQAYNSCTGSSSHQFAYAAFNRNYPSGTIDWGCNPDCSFQDARTTPFCLYSQQPGAGGKGLFPPSGNCFGFFPNEWMTFKVKITLGSRGSNGVVGASPNDEFVNSNFSMWVAREGQASQQVLNFGPYNSAAGSSTVDEKFGKIYLTPYHTEKDATQVHAEGYTWYDELIVSTADIADPGVGGQSPPASPSGFKIK